MSGYKPPSGAGGTSDHAALSNLNWSDSAHVGDANTIATFGSSNEPQASPPSDVRAMLRDGLEIINPASPYTVTSGVQEIIFTAGTSKTVILPALSNLQDSEIIWVFNASASSVNFTLDPPTGATIDGGSDGVAKAYTVPPRSRVGAQRLSSSTWGSVQLGHKINGALIEVSGGSIIGWGGYVDLDGTFVKVGSSVTLTAEDDSYGESISGDVITIAGSGLTTGDTGAIQSNSRRYVLTLSDVGITLSGTEPKTAMIKLLCDSLTDNSEARAGTVAALAWLGVGSTTALNITGIQRPATGSATYQNVMARTSATSLSTGASTNLNFGGFATHEFPNNDNGLYWGGTSSDGGTRGTNASSGVSISSSNPTHLVFAFRASAGASGIVLNDPRVLCVFGSAISLT